MRPHIDKMKPHHEEGRPHIVDRKFPLDDMKSKVDDMKPHMEEIDLEKCLTSGQVFRFRREGETWVGVDGEQIYRLRERDGTILVEGDLVAFRTFFRLDWPYETPPPGPLPATRGICGEGESVIERLVRLGPELVPLVEGARGLRLLRPSCSREALFSFLCTSNNHLTRITQMVGKLASYGPTLDAPIVMAEVEGDALASRDSQSLTDVEGDALASRDSQSLTPPPPLPAGEGEFRRFPVLERLAEITESELREKGFGYRAKTIPLVARELVGRGGESWLREQRTRPYERVFEDLLTLPGVGPKLADCIALYAFDKTEATPIDVHMWRAACPVYFPEWVGTDLTDRKREALGNLLRERFGPLAALAQQVLFFSSLRAGKVATKAAV